MAKSKPHSKSRARTKVTVPATPTATMVVPEPTAPGPLRGRLAEAARNDQSILEAARAVLLADPRAPVSAVAKAAGVGISAMYRRWPAKEDLLRQLCSDGLDRFIAEAEAAVDKNGWTALTGFLRRVVAADVHSLTVHLAGTFTPTPELGEKASRANELADTLIRRAHKSGELRRDITTQDLTLVLEGCAAIRLPDPKRRAELRSRYLELLLDGMSAVGSATLPGPAPQAAELNWRWTPGPGR